MRLREEVRKTTVCSGEPTTKWKGGDYKMKNIVQKTMALGLAVFLVLTLTSMAPAAKKFTLADIPEIKNKKSITIAIEAGGEEGTLLPYHWHVRSEEPNSE